MRGIADGAGVDYRELLQAFQHVNEEFEYAPRFAKTAPAEPGEACSTIVSHPRGGRPSLVAQNLDLAQYLDGFQVLLRSPCDRSDGEILVLTVPGMISLMGMNSHGFAVCDNTLTQLRTDPGGLPIFVLYRMLLESRSLDEAIQLITDAPHAVGLNWVMGDPNAVAMVERSAKRAVRYGPPGSGQHGLPSTSIILWFQTIGRRPLLATGKWPRPGRSSLTCGSRPCTTCCRSRARRAHGPKA